MSLVRRKFLVLGGYALVAALATRSAQALRTRQIKAVAFDAFPLFDPRPIFQQVRKMYPKQGGVFADMWRSRIFQYTWLYASAGQYKDFWTCINNSLAFTADNLKVKLSKDDHKKLAGAFLSLKPYPDVIPTLKTLRRAGIKTGFLSNMTESMLQDNIQSAGLQGLIDHTISTDQVKTYKPDPEAYRLGEQTFGVDRRNMVFVAFAGWDAVGAKWFGYPTVWVNRLGFSSEKIGQQPDLTGRDLSVLTKFVFDR